jgi:hypothetical protein
MVPDENIFSFNIKRFLAFLFVFYIFLGQSGIIAQEKGQIRAGGGLALGTKSAFNDTGDYKIGLGITFGGEYLLTDVIGIAPAYSFFFKSSVTVSGVDKSIKTSAFNVDGKYYFLKKGISVYGLFGFSYGFVKEETIIMFGNVPQTINTTDNSFGINLGGGADYIVYKNIYVNGQVKFNTPLDQVVLNLGVGIYID